MMETLRLESMEEDSVGIRIEIDDEVYLRYQELCADLNLDGHTKEVTWQNFASVRQKYTLEVRFISCFLFWICYLLMCVVPLE